MDTDIPAAVRAIAALQDDVLSRHQLLQHMTPARLRAQLRAGRWKPLGRKVVVLHNGPLTPAQEAWAVLLCCPDDSALSGPTAMAFAGVADPWATGVHVTIPCGERSPRGLDATVHWSRFLGDEDVQPDRFPRRTRLPRSILDWAAWQESDRAARTVVLRGLQSRRTTPELLRTALPGRGPCRHHAVIGETITDAEGGIASVPERDFRELVAAAGLPRPQHQSVRRRPSGRYYLDAEWTRFRLSAEIEGTHHFRVDQRERDLDRLNDLVVEGESVLLFTSFAVRHRKRVVAETLRRALCHRGWVDQLAA